MTGDRQRAVFLEDGAHEHIRVFGFAGLEVLGLRHASEVLHLGFDPVDRAPVTRELGPAHDRLDNVSWH